MKNSPRSDDIITEMLLTAGGLGISELTTLSNIMYSQGCFPSELNKSMLITLPKINGTI